jgi:ATP-dependent RNA helicase SUPV3L1/SUV3
MTNAEYSKRPNAGRGVTAVLGPTNTGKTHLAIERMLSHSSGVIGLPLRLLAREVYTRVVERVGADSVALITGEEKIVPKSPRYHVCTVEALPSEIDASFLAIDEIQIAADLERGHIFTDRILHLRGRNETLLLGAATMRNVVEALVPGLNIVTRPRLSVLSYAGEKKITRMPRRSAVVAFTADEVYAIGELIRRQRGGVAVVLGALSPRTRNAQVELYQNGDVDYIVATDAIGMGLNLDLDHVAFASDRKFDGYQYRRLTPSEFAQVAGRAGRHMRDGTFGVTARVNPLEDHLVEALEAHRFDAVKMVQWRNSDLDFSSLSDLRDSLERAPFGGVLVRAPPAEDQRVLEAAIRDEKVSRLADRRDRIELLWDICRLPDYRRIAPANHADLVLTVYGYLVEDGAIKESWFADQVAFADRTDGDIDTLSNRIAHIRTWNYAANRTGWLANQTHWQERTRAIEDRLSDALHERLTQRFVDRRTSVLMRRLRENAMLDTEITETGDVTVEGQHVGQLDGFRFIPDPAAGGHDAKAIRAAAQKALSREIQRRAEGIAAAGNDKFTLGADATLRWQGLLVAKIAKGSDQLRPRIILLADESLTGSALESVTERVNKWLEQRCQTVLQPLFDLRSAEGLPGPARGLAFRLAEEWGVIERQAISEEVRGLDQDMRAVLRRLGVRFGAHHIYIPQLLKPAPSGLLAMLWGLQNEGIETPGVIELPAMSAAGRTTIPFDPSFPAALYRVVGYSVSGARAVRIDILERLADLIRPLIAWRPSVERPDPPEGAAPPSGFMVTPQMTSLLGASGDDFSTVLKSLGYRVERKPAAVTEEKPSDAEPASVTAVAGASMTGDTDDNTGLPVADETIAPDALAAETNAGAGGAGERTSSSDLESVIEALAGDGSTVAQSATDDAGGEGGESPTSEVNETVGDPQGLEGALAEPSFVEIWRPGRSKRRVSVPRKRPQSATAPDRPEKSSNSLDKTSRPRRKDRPRRSERPRVKQNSTPPKTEARSRLERQPDPDSPFAALAALKADLENPRE